MRNANNKLSNSSSSIAFSGNNTSSSRPPPTVVPIMQHQKPKQAPPSFCYTVSAPSIDDVVYCRFFLAFNHPMTQLSSILLQLSVTLTNMREANLPSISRRSRPYQANEYRGLSPPKDGNLMTNTQVLVRSSNRLILARKPQPAAYPTRCKQATRTTSREMLNEKNNRTFSITPLTFHPMMSPQT